MENKEQDALALIGDVFRQATNPISLCSFGKDSIVVLHLCLRHQKVPVMCWRLARFHEKHQQQHHVAKLWDLEVYDTWPVLTYDYANKGFYEVLHVYGLGRDKTGTLGIMCMTTGIADRIDESRFMCAKDDLLGRPKVIEGIWPWDVTFHGQKSSDPGEFSATASIIQPLSLLGNTVLVCPLHNWTDEDVWAYIHRYNIPYDRQRYEEGRKANSPDSYPTCWNCRDPRHRGESVWCPKYEKTMTSEARSQEEMDRDNNLLNQSLKYCEVAGAPRTTTNTAHA